MNIQKIYEDATEGFDVEITPEFVSVVEIFKDRLDTAVSNMFKEYCIVFGIHRAYGVESYNIGTDTIHIVQDISCRGCYDTAEHTLPTSYLYAKNARELMLQDFKIQEQRKIEKYNIEKQLEISRLKEKLARLEKQ